MSCYCHTCNKYYHPLGIMSHRAAHRRRNQDCKITYTNGDIWLHQFATKPKGKTNDKS